MVSLTTGRLAGAVECAVVMRDCHCVYIQITQDEEDLYSFVVEDDDAALVPFYQPYDAKTEALIAEDRVSV